MVTAAWCGVQHLATLECPILNFVPFYLRSVVTIRINILGKRSINDNYIDNYLIHITDIIDQSRIVVRKFAFFKKN